MPWAQFFTIVGQFLIAFVVTTIVSAVVIAAVKELRK